MACQAPCHHPEIQGAKKLQGPRPAALDLLCQACCHYLLHMRVPRSYPPDELELLVRQIAANEQLEPPAGTGAGQVPIKPCGAREGQRRLGLL